MTHAEVPLSWSSSLIQPILIPSNLEHIAAKVNIPELYLLLILYPLYLHHPNTNSNDIYSLFESLPSPFIICGDLNARRLIWRSHFKKPFLIELSKQHH